MSSCLVVASLHPGVRHVGVEVTQKAGRLGVAKILSPTRANVRERNLSAIDCAVGRFMHEDRSVSVRCFLGVLLELEPLEIYPANAESAVVTGRKTRVRAVVEKVLELTLQTA